MKKGEPGILKLLDSLHQPKWSIIVKGLLCGIIAGALAVIYRILIDFCTETVFRVYECIKLRPLLLLPWTVILLVIGLFIAWLVKLEPMASGSGIPQVKGVVVYGMKMKWYTILAVRFIGGALSAICGLSLGREGPSIQIGAAGGQVIAGLAKKNKLDENYLITGGAAAGLSAAFSAPLSGILFALEEVHRSFSPLILTVATAASLTADVISKNIFGLKPVLNFSEIPLWPVDLYYWLIPLGLISGLCGILVNKGLTSFQSLYHKLPWLVRPLPAIVAAIFCGLFLPEILGGGSNLVSMAQTVRSGISILIILLVSKILFTSISFDSGVPGGIFMPILSIGALSGSIVGIIASGQGISPEYIPAFAVCAMAGALSASVKAPVTGILLAAEMTGSFMHLLPIAACSYIALLFSDLLNVAPIYSTLLKRFISSNDQEDITKEKDDIFEVPVEYGSTAVNKPIREIEWPDGTLIVALKRDEKEIIPCGSTVLLAGDYLVILSADDAENDLGLSVRELCSTSG